MPWFLSPHPLWAPGSVLSIQRCSPGHPDPLTAVIYFFKYLFTYICLFGCTESQLWHPGFLVEAYGL